MKIKKTRMFVGIACVALAAIICFAGIPFAVRQSTKTASVFRVNSNIAKGEAFTKDNVALVEMGDINLPSNVVVDFADVKGKYAVCDLKAGDFVLTSHLTTAPTTKTSLANLPNGMVAITFAMPGSAASFTNQFLAGDIIQFNMYYEPQQAATIFDNDSAVGATVRGKVVRNKLLSYVELYTVNTDMGTPITASQKDEVKYVVATVIVTPEQAQEIIRLQHEASIYLTLIHRGTDKTKDRYLAVQEKWLVDHAEEIKAGVNFDV